MPSPCWACAVHTVSRFERVSSAATPRLSSARWRSRRPLKGPTSPRRLATRRGLSSRRCASSPRTISSSRTRLLRASTACPCPLAFEREARVHLASPPGRSRMQRPGVVGHRLKSAVVEVDGMRVEARADTFIHLASMLSVEELVAIGDWLVSTQRQRAAHRGGADGCAAALRRRTRAQPGSPSARARPRRCRVTRESLLRLLIIGALPEPTLQHEVFDPTGCIRRPARRELASFEARRRVRRRPSRGSRPAGAGPPPTREAARALRWRIIVVTKDDLLDGGKAILRQIVAAYERYSSWNAA